MASPPQRHKTPFDASNHCKTHLHLSPLYVSHAHQFLGGNPGTKSKQVRFNFKYKGRIHNSKVIKDQIMGDNWYLAMKLPDLWLILLANGGRMTAE